MTYYFYGKMDFEPILPEKLWPSWQINPDFLTPEKIEEMKKFDTHPEGSNLLFSPNKLVGAIKPPEVYTVLSYKFDRFRDRCSWLEEFANCPN